MLNFISDTLKRNKKNEKGWTLAELTIIVVAIGIMFAIAIPLYEVIHTPGLHKSVETAAENAATSVASALAKGKSVTFKADGSIADSDNKTIVASGVYKYSDALPIGTNVANVPKKPNTTKDNVLVVASRNISSAASRIFGEKPEMEYAWAGSGVSKGHQWN